MIVPVFLAVGVFATWLSYQAITREMDPRFAATPATVLWFIWSFGALDVDVVTDAGVVTDRYTQLAIIGGLFGLTMMIFTIMAWLGRLNPKAETRYGESEPEGSAPTLPDPGRSREPAFGDVRQNPDPPNEEFSARRDRSPFAPQDRPRER